MKEVSQQELYEMCRQGESSAWEIVYGRVLVICRARKWGLGHKAEDLAQDIVLHLINHALERVTEPENLYAFISTVSTRTILSHLRLAKNRPMHSLNDAEGDRTPAIDRVEARNLTPEQEFASKEVFALIDKALCRLPEYCATVLPLYFKMKLGFIRNYEELSGIVGQSIGTVSSQVNRCLKQLLVMPEFSAWVGESS